jgi:hypothetical protein
VNFGLIYSSSFYNSVWLISNDIIVGTAFGAFLCENNVVLARIISYVVEVWVALLTQGYCGILTVLPEHLDQMDPTSSDLA